MIFDFSPETDYPSLKWHLPFHSRVFKWGDWETVWVFLMCRNDDCYQFHTGPLDGRNTLCINAFLAIPSCIKWTLWGIIHTLPHEKRAREDLKKWNKKQTDIQRAFFFSSFGLIITGFATVRWQRACRIICELKYYNSFHHKTFLSHAEQEIGNRYAVI